MSDPAGFLKDVSHDVELCLLKAWPRQAWRETRILLAVSGGADSVALMRAMLRLTRQPDLIEMAHFNHEWRGTRVTGTKSLYAS